MLDQIYHDFQTGSDYYHWLSRQSYHYQKIITDKAKEDIDMIIKHNNYLAYKRNVFSSIWDQIEKLLFNFLDKKWLSNLLTNDEILRIKYKKDNKVVEKLFLESEKISRWYISLFEELKSFSPWRMSLLKILNIDYQIWDFKEQILIAFWPESYKDFKETFENKVKNALIKYVLEKND